MLKLSTQLDPHVIFDINKTFDKLTFAELRGVLESALRMCDIELGVASDALSDRIIPEAIPVITPFGITNASNIPSGLKAYILALLSIKKGRDICLPECVCGGNIRLALAEACEDSGYVTLYAPHGYFSAAAIPTRKPQYIRALLNGEERELLC